MPDFDKPFIVHSDASDIGIGAVLLQEHPGGLFPVLYASKKPLSRKRNYSVIEGECLALVFAVLKFQKYLYGKEFVLRTDHQPLGYFQRCCLQDRQCQDNALGIVSSELQIPDPVNQGN